MNKLAAAAAAGSGGLLAPKLKGPLDPKSVHALLEASSANLGPLLSAVFHNSLLYFELCFSLPGQ